MVPAFKPKQSTKPLPISRLSETGNSKERQSHQKILYKMFLFKALGKGMTYKRKIVFTSINLRPVKSRCTAKYLRRSAQQWTHVFCRSAIQWRFPHSRPQSRLALLAASDWVLEGQAALGTRRRFPQVALKINFCMQKRSGLH